MKKYLNKWVIGGVGLMAAVVLVVLFSRNSFTVDSKSAAITKLPKMTYPASGLSGIKCENADKRPFAIMLSSDKEARPLSGIGAADMVFEMPVVDVGFTRMMAVYQCGRPKELGSVRSSRLDFVPLAQGLDAIYAHFGGEHMVLEQLNAGVINNIDGLKYDGTYYYRKLKIPRPHNAFTNFDLLTKIANQLGYNLGHTTVQYPHESNSKSTGVVDPPTVFNDKFQVKWRYDQVSNAYFRTRSGLAEVDKNIGRQVSAKNVIIMKTTWSPINKDYIRVKTVGSGTLTLYKNGTVINGTWEKANAKAKLYFYDQNHQEIPLVTGSTWVEIDAHI